MTYVYKILVMKRDRNRTFGRPRHRLENSIVSFIVWAGVILFRIRTSNVPSGFTRGMKLV